MIASLHPALIFVAGAVLVALSPGRLRAALFVLTPVASFANLVLGDHAALTTVEIFDYELAVFRADRLSLLFGYLFHLAAIIGAVFALHLRERMQHVVALLYVGSGLGIVFAGDLVTLFIFWELAAVTSVFLIWARRTQRATAAGFRYLMVQMVSGLLLLAGVLIHVHQTGSTAFGYIGLGGTASWLIFLAFGIKCAFPLLHNWLTDAYPESTPTGTVFLGAFTTKAAIYALARAYPGTELLVYVGATMAVFPIFYAVIENDLRRVLCYSMINQLGFMVAGIGIGTALAINGAVSHAFNDVIFKALLFMSMGAVLHMTGKINGSDLGGLYKTMPVTTTLCIVGAASISAFPLFSGFVSKSMVMAAALEEGYDWVWLLLLLASAGAFHYVGIKIPFFAFFAHDSGIRVKEPPLNMLVAMFIAAALCIGIGAYPWPLYALLPFPMAYVPFDTTHVVAQLQLLFFSALAFAWLKITGLYPPALRSVNIDAEWTYRWFAPRVIRGVWSFGASIDRALRVHALRGVDAVVAVAWRYCGPQAASARTLPTSAAAIWVAVLLGVTLVIYYLHGGD
ncbi:MAG: Na(+)/H(+) antiporter subunit D [Proteobacteria bacterium]|nr:Na(+)/H(+) antiporter subunit D [Pseudomonadota bacterium]